MIGILTKTNGISAVADFILKVFTANFVQVLRNFASFGALFASTILPFYAKKVGQSSAPHDRSLDPPLYPVVSAFRTNTKRWYMPNNALECYYLPLSAL